MLSSQEHCVVTVIFVPGAGSEQRQYHQKMTVGGITADGHYSQMVCLDAATTDR
jgi:hypothetical protein